MEQGARYINPLTDFGFRRLSTQKAVTTEAMNALGEKVHMRLCSESNKSASDIYERLKYKKMPFRKIIIEKSL